MPCKLHQHIETFKDEQATTSYTLIKFVSSGTQALAITSNLQPSCLCLQRATGGKHAEAADLIYLTVICWFAASIVCAILYRKSHSLQAITARQTST